MDAGIITALITAFVGLSVSGITWWSTRKKTSAEAYDKLSATVERQDARMEQFRIEIDALRQRINELEDEGHTLRDRVRTLESEVHNLQNYLRNTIRQLKKADIPPNVPPDVLEQLFKGT